MCIASLYQSIIQNILENINFKKGEMARFNVLVGDILTSCLHTATTSLITIFQQKLSVITEKLTS